MDCRPRRAARMKQDVAATDDVRNFNMLKITVELYITTETNHLFDCNRINQLIITIIVHHLKVKHTSNFIVQLWQ